MNNQTTAKEYADQVAKQWDERNPFQGHTSMTARELTHYLETAFIAGVNHAAARFMEDKAAGVVLAIKEQSGRPTPFTFDQEITLEKHFSNKPPLFAAGEAEQQRLFAVLDQVAVEACAGVNEVAQFLQGTFKLHIFRSGQWQILGRECQGEPFVSYTIPPFQQSEAELAAALRAAFSA